MTRDENNRRTRKDRWIRVNGTTSTEHGPTCVIYPYPLACRAAPLPHPRTHVLDKIEHVSRDVKKAE